MAERITDDGEDSTIIQTCLPSTKAAPLQQAGIL
jgi:hypothetical protein